MAPYFGALFHPDRKEGNTAMQQRCLAAKDELMKKQMRDEYRDLVEGRYAPFTEQIKAVPKAMLECIQKQLTEHEYEQVTEQLQQLQDLPELLKLASVDEKEVQRFEKSFATAVKQHIKSLRDDVDRLWSKRDYRQLNEQLNASDRADKAFSGHDVYDRKWNQKIHESIESEIAEIAAKARLLLVKKSEKEADDCMADFAMRLIELGRLMDNLPRFKETCKHKIARLLDACRGFEWGFCYLFNLGMLLGQGKVGATDEATGNVVAEDDRIGKSIVADFKHFKDVSTMVWNEEVTQKPVKEVAQEAKSRRITNGRLGGEEALDTDALVAGYNSYKAEYDSCFNAWAAGRLQLEQLAQKAEEAAKAVQPASTEEWTVELKKQLPKLIALVFSYFTIVKSGESYTRLNDDNKKGKLKDTNTKTVKKGGKAGGGKSGSGLKMENVLMKPHATQVLTILHMLGYASDKIQLQCQLMQIRTGEGKSIILGACSVVLALLGFRVRCVCYSDYLSNRDYRLFEDLFDAFGVKDWVTYSTIAAYSEDTVERKGNIRSLTEALLREERMEVDSDPLASHPDPPRNDSQKSALPQPARSKTSDAESKKSGKKRNAVALERSESGSENARKAARSTTGVSASKSSRKRASGPSTAPEILLVDEVDVFFGKDFYGQTHNQVVSLDVPEASALLGAVWKLAKGSNNGSKGYGLLLRHVKQSDEYANMLKRFPQWGLVVDREVRAMCADALCYDDPKPHYDRGRDELGYKVMDGIDYDVVYRYRTAFAHLHADDNNIFRNRDAALKRALRLQIPCGKFSYANIRPECILGVSGTLEALGPYERKVMEKYDIRLFASMPSVYGGDTHLTFDHAADGIVIEKSEADFYRTITEEVTKKIREGRAAIVFFETANKLEQYRKSQYFKKVMYAKVLHESLDPRDRDFVIGKAATSGQATFSSAVFGRGTDFFCNDSKLTKAGGVHVLQTFLSGLKAEEVQIKGRTARQGKQGSYGMVLLRKDLEESFGLGQSALENIARGDRYAQLGKARARVHEEACKEIDKDLLEATRLDNLTHEYFDAVLRAEHTSAVNCFLQLFDELRPEESRGEDYHVIFLVDVSGSMGGRDALPSVNFRHGRTFNNRLGCALEACDRFVRTRSESGASDLVSFISFSSSASTEFQTRPVHAELISEFVNGFRPHMSGTDFQAAFTQACTTVRRDASGLPYLIMFLTDGQDGGGGAMSSALALLAQNDRVSMKAIGFGSECDSHNLQTIAAKFGDRGQHIAAIDEVELVSSFEAAAAELSHTGKKR